jgi:hypothetical protein
MFSQNRQQLTEGYSWHRWIDTYLDSPHDIVEWEAAPLVSNRTYQTGARSVVVLWAKVSGAESHSSPRPALPHD